MIPYRVLLFLLMLAAVVMVATAVPVPPDVLPLTEKERTEIKGKYQKLQSWLGGEEAYQTVWRPDRIEVFILDLQNMIASQDVNSFPIQRGPWVLPPSLCDETAGRFRYPTNFSLDSRFVMSARPRYCLHFIRGQQRVELAVGSRGYTVQLQQDGKFVREAGLRKFFWTSLEKKILASAPEENQ